MGNTTPQDLAVRRAADNQIALSGGDVFSSQYSSFANAVVVPTTTPKTIATALRSGSTTTSSFAILMLLLES